MIQESEPLREQRASVIIRAAVHIPGLAAPIDVRVRNLSKRGGCIDLAGNLGQDMIVHLDMGGLRRIEAKVMWLTERLAGLRFARPVDLAAARQPRGTVPAIAAGWIVDTDNPYRR